jgi:hypothetical protein
MAKPTELDSPAALPLHSVTAPFIVVGVRMPESNIELNSGTMIAMPKGDWLVMAASARRSGEATALTH